MNLHQVSFCITWSTQFHIGDWQYLNVLFLLSYALPEKSSSAAHLHLQKGWGGGGREGEDEFACWGLRARAQRS